MFFAVLTLSLLALVNAAPTTFNEEMKAAAVEPIIEKTSIVETTVVEKAVIVEKPMLDENKELLTRAPVIESSATTVNSGLASSSLAS